MGKGFSSSAPLFWIARRLPFLAALVLRFVFTGS